MPNNILEELKTKFEDFASDVRKYWTWKSWFNSNWQINCISRRVR